VVLPRGGFWGPCRAPPVSGRGGPGGRPSVSPAARGARLAVALARYHGLGEEDAIGVAE
jgi:hypothetical protein